MVSITSRKRSKEIPGMSPFASACRKPRFWRRCLGAVVSTTPHNVTAEFSLSGVFHPKRSIPSCLVRRHVTTCSRIFAIGRSGQHAALRMIYSLALRCLRPKSNSVRPLKARLDRTLKPPSEESPVRLAMA